MAAAAYRWVLWGGFLLMLAANLPGHLSFDSVTQLHEGRTGVRDTWAPATMSWILGRFDDVVPGAGLYVTASGLLLFGSLLSLRGLRPRLSWLGVVVALAVVLTPAFLVYQGIVWKDVLFANLAVAGFVCLAHAARRWNDRRGRLALLAAALILLSLGGLVRQNGAVAVLMAAIALGWTARGGGWRAILGWSFGFLVAAFVLSQAISLAVQPPGSSSEEDTRRGVRVLQHYDVVGAIAHDPSLELSVLAAAVPANERVIRAEGVRVYSPQRVDTFHQSPTLGPALWKTPDEVMAAQWRAIITQSPAAYLAQRADVFWWVLATPELDRCLPVFAGVDGPAAKLADLRIAAAVEPQDEMLIRYATRFFDTPLYSHLTYAVLALVLAGFLIWRGEAADMVVAAMLLSALGFAASFFLISVACDYRYLYYLDVASLVGLLYVALDPSLNRRRRRAG
jgi:hypothetical protein